MATNGYPPFILYFSFCRYLLIAAYTLPQILEHFSMPAKQRSHPDDLIERSAMSKMAIVLRRDSNEWKLVLFGEQSGAIDGYYLMIWMLRMLLWVYLPLLRACSSTQNLRIWVFFAIWNKRQKNN
jgi:hypothetical protein